MEKIDLHLHLTLRQIPRLGKLDLASARNMLPHLDKLGIGKGVLMSAGEKRVPFGSNRANRAICRQFPDRYAWMCNLDPRDPDSVYARLAEYQAQGAVGVGELTVNRRLRP